MTGSQTCRGRSGSALSANVDSESRSTPADSPHVSLLQLFEDITGEEAAVRWLSKWRLARVRGKPVRPRTSRDTPPDAWDLGTTRSAPPNRSTHASRSAVRRAQPRCLRVSARLASSNEIRRDARPLTARPRPLAPRRCRSEPAGAYDRAPCPTCRPTSRARSSARARTRRFTRFGRERSRPRADSRSGS